MKTLNFLLLTIVSFSAVAQTATDERWSIEGKVINATNQEPVTARIIYESLPYGGSIGFLKGDNFSVYIPRETEFRLKVEADGYAPYSYDIGLHEFQEGHFFTVVELMPNGANHLIRLEKLIFDLGKANITKDSYQELDMIVNMLNENPNMVIQLEGHTDFRGNAKQNMRLSEERVESVRSYLIEKGIEKKRIKTKAFGGTQPLNRKSDAESRERNRRVEVRILSNED